MSGKLKSPKAPEKAFILAAGLGTRMKPLTNTTPKPLAVVAGQTLLERTLDQLQDAGVNDVVINTHHLPHKINARLEGRESPALHFSHEDVLLDTGGGIVKMLRHFSDDPFYVLSGDGLFTGDALGKLAASWDPDKMDILLLLQPLSTFKLTTGKGDYDLLPGGKAVRSLIKTGQYMFTSIRINHPRIFKSRKAEPFSYLELMDEAEKAGRLYGLVHDGDWHHISTVADLESVNRAFGA
jgi:N-acetyl-alpha-D-muramate 1-phosphate uridylyltransferase